MERRTYLAALGGALTVGTAGCIDGSSEDGSDYESGYRPDEEVGESALSEATPTAEIGLDEGYEFTRERTPESFRLDLELSGDWVASGVRSATTALDGSGPHGRGEADTEAGTVRFYGDESGLYMNHPDEEPARTHDEFRADLFFLAGLGRDIQQDLAFEFVEGGTVPNDQPDGPERIRAFRYDLSAIRAFNYDRYGSASGELVVDELGAVRELHAEYSGAERETETPAEDGLKEPTPGNYGSEGEGSASLVMSGVGETTVERPDWVDRVE